MRYRIGDELVLKVEEKFGHTDTTYRQVKVQVVGQNIDGEYDEAEYLVYVPPYEHLAGSWPLTSRHAQWYGIHKKFIGDSVAFIAPNHPIYKHLPAPQGSCCARCMQFAEGMVSSPTDPYMCRACKLDPYR